MKFKIDGPDKEKGRGIYIDDDPHACFYIKEEELHDLLYEARYGSWGNDPQKGMELGQKLFNLLNRNNGRLRQAIDEHELNGKDLTINLVLPMDLAEIPFELLYHKDFIVLQRNIHIMRQVSEKNRTVEKENRPLKILFAAASPVDLKESTLKFENEEDLILKVTEKYPLDFQVEDTGSLEGIEQILYEIDGADILHISGHAGHDIDSGPVFYMEDEVGRLDKVTPERLYNAIKDILPKVLFLSGCSTGKTDKNIGVESFACQLVDKGIPFVLGWGLPVSDYGATSFAGVFYEKLAKGSSIEYAIHEARLSARDNYHPWPLMRLFTDGTKCEALVKRGQKNLKKSGRQIMHKNLSDSNVTILDKGFIGRRRELQKALAVLKNKPPFENRYGMLIHGPAGVGKSCLAGRVFERQRSYGIIVFRGKLEQSMVIHGLKKYFDKQGDKPALDVLGSDRSYEEKIKELYRSVFKEKNIIIYFDDLEDNLCLENGTWYFKTKFLNNFRPFLQYVDYAENQSKIVITSRYPFDLQADGGSLLKRFLEEIPLISFTGPDENKKINELTHIAQSKNIKLYRQFGHGNPRLMEWLDKIAADEKKYKFDELKEVLAGQEEEYIRKYLADIIAEAEGTEFMTFLYKSAVYRLPVEKSAFEKMGDEALLNKGVELTLFEKEAVMEQEDRYWVMPVIRQQMWDKLDKARQREADNAALGWYNSCLEDKEIIPYHNEALIISLEVNRIDDAARHVLPIGDELNRLLCYQQQKELLDEVCSRVDEKVIIQAKKDEKQSVSELLNQNANLYMDLGDAKKAVDYYEQALEIDLEVFGDKHLNVISEYLNLADFFKSVNSIENELKYLIRALEPLKELVGTENESTILIMKRIAELKEQNQGPVT